MKLQKIPVVDLFAGPGGLGEGFSSVGNGTFQIVISAEKDKFAHETLLLRAYYRILLRENPKKVTVYLDYCKGIRSTPWDDSTLSYWKEAEAEARQIELGSEDGNQELDIVLKKALTGNRPWILIGGPPCQAYSLAGRSRNKGKIDYQAEKDPRHFLYKEYLRTIQKYRPSVFVMENVKGILSSKVNGELIFHSILKDLTDPDAAFDLPSKKFGYRIYSLVSDVEFKKGDSPLSINPHDFIVRSEEHGVPQARHRVILLGVREDFLPRKKPKLNKLENMVSVEDVLSKLPPLRSHITKCVDSAEAWQKHIKESAEYLVDLSLDEKLSENLISATKKVAKHVNRGGLRVLLDKHHGQVTSPILNNWYSFNSPGVWLNHEARGHMESDLRRYLFASAFAKTYGRSPKGAADFNIEGLKPNHKNWESGDFSDRFRVQLSKKPSTTITSHISKDGHYFIHYDPSQCRSLTVREAARLQTFPDNYFFQGNRTQQYHQVGNAVPPYLAWQIGSVVQKLFIAAFRRESRKAGKRNARRLARKASQNNMR
jgi:DNA (cytosine-5)-methyltransferase 1